jgi:thioredoxin-related protein
MKNTTIIIALLANSIYGYSQEWKTNLNEAFKEASVSGKDVLLYFTVIENCDSCAKLEQNVMQSNLFKSYARENFVLVKQDFNSGNMDNIEENLLIVEKYNKDGFFPLVVIINKSAKILGQIGAYNNEMPEAFLSQLESIKRG